MLQDFEVTDSPWPDGSGERRPHVCILGAGAAGILLATELAEHGMTVLVLEAGGLELEERSQELYKTVVTGERYLGALFGRVRTYGGSTTRWGGQILELDAADFAPRKHVPGSGWPFSKEALDPYYERALRFEGLRLAEREDAKVWSGLGLSICDLGPEFRMSYSRWCPERDFTRLKRRTLLESTRIRVVYHANAVGFLMGTGQGTGETAIQAVRVRGYSGGERLVSADRYVICLGGIETTRLLLQPQSEGTTPWQRNTLLGRHYLDHVCLNQIPIRAVAMQPVERYFGYPMLAGFRYHNKIRLSQEEQRKAETLNVAGTIGPWRSGDPAHDEAAVLLRNAVHKAKAPTAQEWRRVGWHLPVVALETAAQLVLGEGPEWKRTMLSVHSEQEPLSDSSITLSEERDALGMLRARVDWRISKLELHTLRTYVRRAMTVFGARRFAQVVPPKGFFEDDGVVRSLCVDSNHHMGGVRMGSTAQDGVVDTDLKLHGVRNAYVLSSAVFPAGGFSNPTHTLLALGMRLADRLAALTAKDGFALAEPLRLGEPARQVELARTGCKVPQLGFGCAYLLGPGLDRVTSLRLLDAAYDAGIRHFDTARLYGQGEGEALLGEFLRRRPLATVTTKFGLEPPNLVQRGLSAAGRKFPRMERLAAYTRGTGKVRFTAREAQKALERSLRALGREEVAIFLLHEPRRLELVHDDLLEFLESAKASGKIGDYGIGGEAEGVTGLYATRRAYTPVLQFEHSIFAPTVDVPEAYRIHYRVFARAQRALTERFRQDRGLGWWWSEMVGADLQEPAILSRLLLRAALDEFPGSLTLFSTSTEAHLYEIAGVAGDQRLQNPAERLRKLAKEADLGIREQLYGRERPSHSDSSQPS